MHTDRGQLVLSFFHRSSREKLRLSGLVVHSLYWLSHLRFVNYVHVCQWECACIPAGTIRVQGHVLRTQAWFSAAMVSSSQLYDAFVHFSRLQ